MWVLLLTLVAVAATVVDVIRRPQEAWTSGRERTAWLVLLLVPAVVTLASFSFVGPLLAVVVVVAYCASRWGRKRAKTEWTSTPTR